MEPTKMLVVIKNEILLFIPSKCISINGYISFSLVPQIEIKNCRSMYVLEFQYISRFIENILLEIFVG